MLFMSFRSIGLNLIVEDSSSLGRAEMTVILEDEIFVFEFKMAKEGETSEAALDRVMNQMRDRQYTDKYRYRGDPIHLIAVVFGHARKNLLNLRGESI